MDTIPDYEIPKAPKGFKYVGFRHPKKGDYMIDYYGKPYLIKEDNQYIEHWPVYKKIK